MIDCNKAKKRSIMTTILAVHNTTAKKLRFAEKLGGMPCPSIAYYNADHKFDNFGDITLLCSNAMANPADRSLLACDSDIYSSRFPNLGFDIDRKKLKDACKRVEEIDSFFEDKGSIAERILDVIESAPVEDLAYRLHSMPALYIAFREEVLGETFNPSDWAQKERKYSVSISDAPEIQEWVNNHVEKSGRAYIRENDEGIGELKEIADTIIRKKADDIGKTLEKKKSSALHKGRDADYFYDRFRDELFVKDAEGNDKLSLQTLAKLERDYETWSVKSMPLDASEASRVTIGIDDDTLNKLDVWLEEKFSDTVKKAYYRHQTPSGNVIKKAMTLDNITNTMKKGLRGGENFNYGAGNIRSQVANNFRTWRTLEAQADRLVEEDAFQVVKDKTNDKLLELIDEIRPFYRFQGGNHFMQTDDIVEIISEYASGRFSSLKEGFEITEDFPRDKIDSFLQSLRTMETQYFEGKFKRAVTLDEFSAALMPKSVMENAPDIVNMLTRKGLTIDSYDPNVEGDRERKVRQLAEENGLVRKGAENSGMEFSR